MITTTNKEIDEAAKKAIENAIENAWDFFGNTYRAAIVEAYRCGIDTSSQAVQEKIESIRFDTLARISKKRAS